MFFLNFFGSKKDTLALIETGGSILFARKYRPHKEKDSAPNRSTHLIQAVKTDTWRVSSSLGDEIQDTSTTDALEQNPKIFQAKS
jgi:hypothetical protein